MEKVCNFIAKKEERKELYITLSNNFRIKISFPIESESRLHPKKLNVKNKDICLKVLLKIERTYLVQYNYYANQKEN